MGPVDLDAEMAKLSAEARKKLDAERPEPADEPAETGPAPPRAKARPSEADDDAEARREARKLLDAAKVEEDEASDDDKSDLSLGAKIAIVVGGLIALSVAWRLILEPLIGVLILVGIVALVVIGIGKLMGKDPEDAMEKKLEEKMRQLKKKAED
jgi:uncharacterized membrane protein